MINHKTGMSPYEIMNKIKPKLTHLHEFGCDVYVLIPNQKRRKLDEKAEKMKFIGYDVQAKGYRLVDEN